MAKDKLSTPLLNYYSSLNQPKMNAKKMYRIELYTLDYGVAKDTAMVAAYFNGQQCSINLIGLQAYANVKIAEMGYTDMTVTLIGNVLHIDKGTKALLKLEEVEVMELELPQITSQEAKDILPKINPNEVPTINRGTLIDGNADELLN